MKRHNKSSYCGFVSINKPIKRYYRYIFVKEPQFWYNRKSIEVRIEFGERCDVTGGKLNVTGHEVFIVCSSIDNFYMYQITKVQDENEFKEVKKRLFDRMPNNLSMKWLWKHGFVQM